MMTRLLGMVLLAAASALAQGQASRSMFPWWDSPVARDLNLSDEQARHIRTTLREQRSHLIDLRAAVEKAEGDVEDLFNEDAVDQKRTADAIEKLVQARTDLTRVFSMLSLKLRAVLTPQQWRELQRRRPQPPQPRAPGQPQGPPPGRPGPVGPGPGPGPGAGPVE